MRSGGVTQQFARIIFRKYHISPNSFHFWFFFEFCSTLNFHASSKKWNKTIRDFIIFSLFSTFTITLSKFLRSQRTLRVPSCQMAVRIVDKRGETLKEYFSITDANGVNWCFQAITNVHRDGFDTHLYAVCIAASASCSIHHRRFSSFDASLPPLRSRSRIQKTERPLEKAVIAEDCTRRPCEIVRIVKEAASLSRRGEASLTQFILRKTTTHTTKFPRASPTLLFLAS